MLRCGVVGAVAGGAIAFACGGTPGQIAAGIVLGGLFGAGFGAGLYYAYQPMLAFGALWGLGQAAAAAYDGIRNGWNTCNLFNLGLGLAMAALSGSALARDVRLGGWRLLGPPMRAVGQVPVPARGEGGELGDSAVTGDVRNMPTSLLRFTQAEASAEFGTGPWKGLSIEEVAQGLRTGKLSMKPLLVFLKTPEMDAWPTTTHPKGYTGNFANLENWQYYSINNRGLAAAILAEKGTVPVRVISEPAEIIEFSYEFDTRNYGLSILIRGLNKVIHIP